MSAQNITSHDHLKLALSTLASLGDNNFECSICLDTLYDPHVISECLHRFCGACCVKESIRKCIAECPTCRTRITLKRGLRNDKYLQDIVSDCDCDWLSVIHAECWVLSVSLALEDLLVASHVCVSTTTNVDGLEDSYASESCKSRGNGQWEMRHKDRDGHRHLQWCRSNDQSRQQ